jgi:CheY-like chemotaxis protein
MPTILIVDDERLVLGLLRRVLLDAGFTLLEADSGETALALSRSHAGPIDILLTDLKMPGMCGQELARSIAAERPDIRVIYMSGYSDQSSTLPRVGRGAASFLAKPFTRNTLLAQVLGAVTRPAQPELRQAVNG